MWEHPYLRFSSVVGFPIFVGYEYTYFLEGCVIGLHSSHGYIRVGDRIRAMFALQVFQSQESTSTSIPVTYP